MTFTEIKKEVLKWANERGLLESRNGSPQLIKTVEELGELGKAHLEDNPTEIIDAIGDMVVCLTIYANQRGFDIEDCFLSAWSEIQDRKGKTINGTFIRE
jgi:NTP pyrophosphatase (non-canonical NTP hydrolase)